MIDYVSKILKDGSVGVLPTDTLYGIVGSAFSKPAVFRIYRLKKRTPTKACIVLIGSISELKKFGVRLTPQQKKFLDKIWPGPVSVLFKASSRFRYLHRGTHEIAFRLPKPTWLRSLLLVTGPLIAPSANYEGVEPAKTMRETQRHFGYGVDFYMDGGQLRGKSSTLLGFRNGRVRILREGVNAEKIKKIVF